MGRGQNISINRRSEEADSKSWVTLKGSRSVEKVTVDTVETAREAELAEESILKKGLNCCNLMIKLKGGGVASSDEQRKWLLEMESTLVKTL